MIYKKIKTIADNAFIASDNAIYNKNPDMFKTDFKDISKILKEVWIKLDNVFQYVQVVSEHLFNAENQLNTMKIQLSNKIEENQKLSNKYNLQVTYNEQLLIENKSLKEQIKLLNSQLQNPHNKEKYYNLSKRG